MGGQRTRPAYMDVADDLRTKIRAGQIAPGSLLPSLPELEAEYAATNGVVRRALQELRQERLVRTTQGRRAEVCDPGEWASTDAVEITQRLGRLVDGFAEMSRRVDAIERRLRELEP